MIREIELRSRFSLALSAASGLVLRDGIAYAIGDDRAALDRHRLADGMALPPMALLDLPADTVLRKKDKPDLEALIDLGDGTLLALGSGSRKNRARGFRMATDGAVQAIDLSALYSVLSSQIEDLNIEGAVMHEGLLVLAHRGVGSGDASRLIRLDPREAFDPTCTRWTDASLRKIESVALGELAGVALSFTDLACDERGVLHYLAAAEATDDAYLDGACLGSVIGRIEPDGHATTIARLRPDVKAEGLAFLAATADTTRWLVVTDADDPAKRATLYELEVPR